MGSGMGRESVANIWSGESKSNNGGGVHITEEEGKEGKG